MILSDSISGFINVNQQYLFIYLYLYMNYYLFMLCLLSYDFFSFPLLKLGLGTTSSESTPRPIRALLSRKVIVAACSYHHSFILCADGALFSCGRNDSGQLGHGDTVDKKTPQSVLNCPKGIISISCGQFHTLAATTSGVAYVCGKNDYGQLGMEVNGNVKVFSEITNHPEIDQVVQVCCGYYHSLLLSNTGVVVGFGRNDYGQVSFNRRYRYNSSPNPK